MPIYEYQCVACGHRLETIQKVSDPVLTECPQCAEPQLKKLVSLAAFRLKGGGWYETDFKSGTRKNVHGEGKEGGGNDAGSSAGSTGGEASGTTNGGDTGKKATSSESDSRKPKPASPPSTGGSTE